MQILTHFPICKIFLRWHTEFSFLFSPFSFASYRFNFSSLGSVICYFHESFFSLSFFWHLKCLNKFISCSVACNLVMMWISSYFLDLLYKYLSYVQMCASVDQGGVQGEEMNDQKWESRIYSASSASWMLKRMIER